jgi:hypothetical protein
MGVGNEQRERNRRIHFRWVTIGTSVLIVVLLTLLGWRLLYPYSVGPEQPIPFSHRIHAGVRDINCIFCHDGADRSQNAGMPAVGKCLLCHNVIAVQFAPIQRIHTYYNKKQPIPWNRVNQLPDYVHFRHQIHLANGIDCSRCHGNVKDMDRIETVHQFEMGFCVDCHKNNQATQSCSACHY